MLVPGTFSARCRLLLRLPTLNLLVLIILLNGVEVLTVVLHGSARPACHQAGRVVSLLDGGTGFLLGRLLGRLLGLHMIGDQLHLVLTRTNLGLLNLVIH